MTTEVLCQKNKDTGACNLCGYTDCQHIDGKKYNIGPGETRPSGDCITCGLGTCNCSSEDNTDPL